MTSATVTVLGFRGGRPDATSSCSGYLVTQGARTILVDCGPGIVGQLLSRGLEHRLDAIVLTHLHQDHCLDIVPLAFNRLLTSGVGRIPLLVPADAVRHLEQLDQWAEAPNDPAVGRPIATAFDIWPMPRDGTTRLPVVEDVGLTAYPGEHPVPSAALRFDLGGATLAFSSDSSWCAGVLDAARDVDLFVCEAAFLDSDPELLTRFGHLSPELAGRLAVRAGVRHLLLTHLSGRDDEACHTAASAVTAGRVDCTLAQVGLTVDVGGAIVGRATRV